MGGEQLITPKKKPFKLCFCMKKILGQSEIRKNPTDIVNNSIDIKFYAKHEVILDVTEEEINEKLKQLTVKDPRKVLERLITENQKYGWYQVILTDQDRSDPRLNHAKRTNVIVREHLMNYAKIRQ